MLLRLQSRPSLVLRVAGWALQMLVQKGGNMRFMAHKVCSGQVALFLADVLFRAAVSGQMSVRAPPRFVYDFICKFAICRLCSHL